MLLDVQAEQGAPALFNTRNTWVRHSAGLTQQEAEAGAGTASTSECLCPCFLTCWLAMATRQLEGRHRPPSKPSNTYPDQFNALQDRAWELAQPDLLLRNPCKEKSCSAKALCICCQMSAHPWAPSCALLETQIMPCSCFGTFEHHLVHPHCIAPLHNPTCSPLHVAQLPSHGIRAPSPRLAAEHTLLCCHPMAHVHPPHAFAAEHTLEYHPMAHVQPPHALLLNTRCSAAIPWHTCTLLMPCC
mmetsp:Transcript_25117/g.64858  ORF Transcript_25117/g.64858 Transcript_25117/m.64858 type:complete len:244 (+) Transcript_25117:607-1338(+)